MSKKDPTLPNAKVYKISTSIIPNFIAQTEKLSKLTPGPGLYKPVVKDKVLGNFKTTGQKSVFYEENVFRGMATPAPYNSINTERYKMSRTQEWKFPKPLKEAPLTIKKDNSPSPTTYAFETKTNASSLHPKPINYTINKAKKQCFLDKEVEYRKGSPGCAKYDPKLTFVTLGARRGYK